MVACTRRNTSDPTYLAYYLACAPDPRAGRRNAVGRAGKSPSDLHLLGPPSEAFRTRRIPLDWYPKVEAVQSESVHANALGEVRHIGKLAKQHLAFFDLDAVYQEIVRYKSERGWDSLIVTRDIVKTLLEDPS